MTRYGSNLFCEIRGVKFIWKKISGLKILGFSEENTPGGYFLFLDRTFLLMLMPNFFLLARSEYLYDAWPQNRFK